MSELTRKLKERVDQEIRPHVEMYGDNAPVVKMALLILKAAEDIEREIEETRVTTDRASELTGWAKETLQSYARKIIDGEELPEAWRGLKVERSPSGYTFVLGTIPSNPRSAAA